ncbi:MAG TPA: hypothetical protein VLA19_07805 [Herpetosiphonaceae bacterium]|nr:hypothetical protein [Herpetosiphonaceae bacterium]
MLIDIELTQRADGHYVARALQIPDVVTEAASRDAALEQMRAALVARRRSGVELVRIDIGDEDEMVPTGWPRHAGVFPDDDAYREMLAEVERHGLITPSTRAN